MKYSSYGSLAFAFRLNVITGYIYFMTKKLHLDHNVIICIVIPVLIQML